VKRSIRRHQQRMAKFRRTRILLIRVGGRALSSGHREPRNWKAFSRFMMSEPGWWVHDRVIVPARTETRFLEHNIEHGQDPESIVWPDCKKPHDYYW
jgi:hypothetical protein